MSAEFILERDVLQGSVLSPVLFLLVIDPLLRELERSSLGPSVYCTYASTFAHADGICTVTSSLPSQIGRRIHKISKSHSTPATRVALKWPSVAARILTRKLNLLFKISSEGESISCHMFTSLCLSDSCRNAYR